MNSGTFYALYWLLSLSLSLSLETTSRNDLSKRPLSLSLETTSRNDLSKRPLETTPLSVSLSFFFFFFFFYQLSNLESLNASQNLLMSIDGHLLLSLTAMTELDISHNLLQCVPMSVACLCAKRNSNHLYGSGKLRSLDISYNRIFSPHDLPLFPLVESLGVCFNHLSSGFAVCLLFSCALRLAVFVFSACSSVSHVYFALCLCLHYNTGQSEAGGQSRRSLQLRCRDANACRGRTCTRANCLSPTSGVVLRKYNQECAWCNQNIGIASTCPWGERRNHHSNAEGIDNGQPTTRQ